MAALSFPILSALYNTVAQRTYFNNIIENNLFIAKNEEMKTLYLSLTGIVATISICNAQCDKNVTWTSSKTEFLDSSGNVTKSKDESAFIKKVDKTITVTPPGSADNIMNGSINQYSCNYTSDGKNGKIVIGTQLTGGNGEVVHATITVTTVEGQTTILLVAKEKPDRRIKLYISNYEVAK